jgi:hypothetical protein
MTDEQVIAIPMGMGGSVPQAARSDRADLLDKIKPEQLVETIRQRLLGKEYINGEWREVAALKDRKLTEIGAWEISNLMLGVSSINISISSFNDQEIKKRLLGIAKTTQKTLVANYKEFGIKTTSQLWFIHEIVFSNTLGVLKQADNASIQDLLKNTVQENRNVNTEVKREGRLKRMLGLGQ